MSKTITATIGAFITGTAYGPADLMSPHAKPESVCGSMLGYSGHDMTKYGWTRVGTAEIKVTLFDESAMVENKIEALRHEQKTVLADAQKRHTEIERQIQTLLAITFDSAEVSA